MKVTSGRTSFNTVNESSIVAIHKSYVNSFKNNKNQKEVIITTQQQHIIPLIHYITLEVLNTCDVTIEQLQLLNHLLNKAKDDAVNININNLLLEYLINICCVLIIKESKPYKKEHDIKTYIDCLMKIIDIAYSHLIMVDHLFYKKIIILMTYMKSNYSFRFLTEHNFILEFIDVLDLSEKHIDEIKDSFRIELFVDYVKRSVLHYLYRYNDNKIMNLIYTNSNILNEVNSSLRKFKTNLNEYYNNAYIKNFTRKIVERASSSNNKMRKIEMNYLFKKLVSLHTKYSNVAAGVLANMITIKKMNYSYEWKYIFTLLNIIDKNVIDERSKLDATIVEAIDMYNKQQYYGTFSDFETLCLNKYFKFQNIELSYQKIKMDYVFRTYDKFIKHFPIICEHYLNHFVKSDMDINRKTINYLFEWLEVYYHLYSNENDDEYNQLNKIVMNCFFPFYNVFMNLAVCEHDINVSDYTAGWELIFAKIMKQTSSYEVVDSGFELVHKCNFFLINYPLQAIKKIMKNAFMLFETFKIEMFCKNTFNKFLRVDNPFSELHEEIYVINFIFNVLQMCYFSDNGFVYYKRMPVIGVSPMIHVDTLNLIENNNNNINCVSFSVKDILNYFKKFICTNLPHSTDKNKKQERKFIWRILNYKSQTNIHFFKAQDISIIHEFIQVYLINNKLSKKQSKKEKLLIFNFLNNICEYISENDTRIFKGITLEQNDNFYIMKTYLQDYAELIVDEICAKYNGTYIIEAIFDYENIILPYIVIFIHITKTLEHYICTAYQKQNIHFGIINGILREFILKVLFKIRCCLANQSKNNLNNMVFCIFKFLSATKDIILQNPEITKLTVLLLSTLSFESHSNVFLKEFKKKFITELKDLNIKDFNLFKSTNVNIQLQISIDYLIYYLLSKTKDISFTKDVVNIYHQILFKKESKKIHKQVFTQFIKWSLIEKDVNRNNNTKENRKFINENLNIEYSIKIKQTYITVLTSKKDSSKYSVLTKSPFLNFYFAFIETFTNLEHFNKQLEHYFGYDVSNKKYQESNEEKIRLIQQVYQLQNFQKELSKQKQHGLTRSKEQEQYHIDKLDNIEIYRTFKVNVIWYNNNSNIVNTTNTTDNGNDNVEYSNQFKEFMNGLKGDSGVIERDDKSQIKVIHYKDIINKIDFHIKQFIPSENALGTPFIRTNCYTEEEFQKMYLDYVSIIYVENDARYKIEKIIKLINDDQEYKNKFYIIIHKQTSDTYQIELHDSDNNNKKYTTIIDFFVHVMFCSINDCVSFIKHNLLEMIIMLNIQEQYRSSGEYILKNVDKEMLNSYYSEYDNMYKRYQYISENM